LADNDTTEKDKAYAT